MAETREEIAIKRGPSPTGIPMRLSQRLWDGLTASILLFLLFLVAELGIAAKAKLEAEGGGEHGEHGGHGHGHGAPDCEPVEAAHHRQLSSHGDTYITDMQVTLGICVLLVVVTIFFESVKGYLQANVPVQLLDVLRAMFGELMVLGFIALFT